MERGTVIDTDYATSGNIEVLAENKYPLLIGLVLVLSIKRIRSVLRAFKAWKVIVEVFNCGCPECLGGAVRSRIAFVQLLP